ncbi:hypothetical protein IAQ61_008941 [Plenodomus lingam]|uniref:uncharacterized protein n=1 Tax=Leptosphaeria maculans TaxID=5022 RepID=UPI00332F87DE|nr:hypothetical protein IAQ61_008941 [Plenodomus lingam]
MLPQPSTSGAEHCPPTPRPALRRMQVPGLSEPDKPDVLRAGQHCPLSTPQHIHTTAQVLDALCIKGSPHLGGTHPWGLTWPTSQCAVYRKGEMSTPRDE